MDRTDIICNLSEILNCEAKQREPLSRHTTFKIGGAADAYISVTSLSKLSTIVRECEESEIDWMVIGNGSNLLVSDEGYRGAVLRLDGDFRRISLVDDCTVYCGAGASLAALCKFALSNGLSGLEFAWGIPGTVGGAVFMNAGAYGREIKDIAVSVRYWEDGEIKEISASECGFAYRTSIFDRKNANGSNAVILSLKAAMPKGDREKILAYCEELRQKRTASQPLDVPSAGSTFKRPEGHFAAKLIEDSGLKGFALDDSGAQVSPKHAGFVVNNNGTAKAEDILKLIDYISGKVYEDSGVRLEKEVRLIGEFGGKR